MVNLEKEIDNLKNGYNDNLILELSKTKILNETDINMLEVCMPNIIHGMQHSQIFRTETEARVSVLQDIKFPTPDSKYWQSVREMNVQASELFMLNFNYKTKIEDLRLAEYKAASCPINDDVPAIVEKNKAIIECEKLRFELLQMERVAKDRIREITMWTKITNELKPQLRYSADNVNEHQLVSYGTRFANEMVACMKTGAMFGPGEARNHLGLLQTTIHKAYSDGKLKEVMCNLSPDVQKIMVDKKLVSVK